MVRADERLRDLSNPARAAPVVVRPPVEHSLLVSELADHELRRELLRIGADRSVAYLDELTRELACQFVQRSSECKSVLLT